MIQTGLTVHTGYTCLGFRACPARLGHHALFDRQVYGPICAVRPDEGLCFFLLRLLNMV